MRLITDDGHGNFRLQEYDDNNTPRYAILSHTWGADGDEVTFQDFTNGTAKYKPGYRKIEFCKSQAAKDGLQYFWIDTCCIDKSSSAELSEAINSMFQWYGNAAKCYVYLSDVSESGLSASETQPPTAWEANFRRSRWFSRGWTLQELIAPASVEFFSTEGACLGSKRSLERQLHEITGIPIEALCGAPLVDFEIEERLSWARHRETKRVEDKAYSLCGLFNIRMSLFYGEGRDRAFQRLHRKVEKALNEPIRLPERLPAPSSGSIIPTRAGTLSKDPSCTRWCSCRCHRIVNLRSPQLLSSSMGNLSIRLGAERSSCNESSCQRRNKSTTVITYRFPKWLINSAINFSLVSSALSTQSNLTTLRIIPDSAEIFGAVSAGDVTAMQRLFQEGRASIHDMDEHGWTLLHRAFLLGREEVCRFLLTQGADTYIEADNGSSVVERAWLIAQSNTKSLTENAIYNSDVLTHVDIYEFVQSQQYTVIHKIILGLSKIPLSQYLEASTDGINDFDARGYTPLFWACAKSNENAVRLLLRYGADPNGAGRILQTPLHVAQTPQIVRSLLEHGADVDCRDSSARTPLHTYCYHQILKNPPSLIEEIITGGASVNAKTTAGHTALHYATAFGNTHLIPILLKHGIDIDDKKASGDTALALAVRHNQVDAMKVLVGSFANVSIRNKQEQSVLHIGASFGRIETLEFLATCDLTGLSPYARDKRGFSAFDYFDDRQDRFSELEAAFARLASSFPKPTAILEEPENPRDMDEVRRIPGAF